MGAELSTVNLMQRQAAQKSLEEMVEAVSKAILEVAKLEGPLTEASVSKSKSEVIKLCGQRAEASAAELNRIIRRRRMTQMMGAAGGMRMGGMDPLQKLHMDLMALELLNMVVNNDDDEPSGISGATRGASGGGTTIAHPWTENELLGSGTFGTVHAAEDKNDQKFAVKEVPRDEVDEDALKDQLRVLAQLSHKNVVKSYGCAMGKDTVYIYMELMQVSVKDRIEKNGRPIPQGMAKKYTRDLMQGLIYIHGKGVIHRDIKCSNVLLDAAGTAKLADIGMSRIHAQKTLFGVAGQKAGAICWMSPETVSSRQTGKKSDVWSVGCTVYEMVKGKPPFVEEMPPTLFGLILPKMIENLEHRQLVSKQDELGSSLQNFLLKIFTRMEKRPFAEKLAGHPWLK